MANTIIYSASAGSGKTFRLVVEYLSLLLKNTKAYRNILAVTFTNKATLEMKQRIMKVLQDIASNSAAADNYIQEIISNTSLTKEEIHTNSLIALRNILHDYSNFYIETIDTFFQRILRNLTKEIGVASSYNLLLDDRDYTRQAVHLFIEDAYNEPQLKNWFEKFIQNRIEKGVRWNFEKDLTSFTFNNLRKITVREYINEDSLNLQNLSESVKHIQQQIDDFISIANTLGNELLEVCKRENLTIDSFKGKDKSSIYLKFYKLKNYSRQTEDNLTVNNAENVITKWLTKDDLMSKTADVVTNSLMPLYAKVNALFENSYTSFIDRITVLQNIYQTGLLKYIFDIKQRLLREDNAFVLSDTPVLLAQIVGDNNDVSFIFEKIGSMLKYIMLDEFQDTSVIDWQNLRLLLMESLAENYNCFLFGDVKQAIYRWREGDWRMLNGLITKESPDTPYLYPTTKYLENNFRTGNKIVEFNNSFFSQAYERKNTAIAKSLKQITKKTGGEVRYTFLKREDQYDLPPQMFTKLKQEIDYYLQQGYKLNDIAVLCRRNDNIRDIAEYLKKQSTTEYNYNPSSDEAFAYSSSEEILTIINALQYIDDKQNTISLAYVLQQRNEDLEKWLNVNKNATSNIEYLYDVRQKKNLPLMELVIEVAKALEINQSSAFVMSFYDAVLDYVTNKSSSLKGFLAYWESELKNKTITSTEGDNALRITSIHKAKGLEYPVVIIPYCNWDFYNGREKIWVKTQDNSINIPIFNATVAQLKKTSYQKDYEEEENAQYIDSLNLLYVAFTRAKYGLSIIAQKKERQSSGGDVSGIIHDWFMQQKKVQKEISQDEESFFIKDENILFTVSQQENNINEQIKTVSADSTYNYSKVHLGVSSDAIDYFSKNHLSEPVHRGIMLHKLMSMIKTTNDKFHAISKIQTEYELNEKQIAEINLTVEKMLAFAVEYKWFDDKYKVLIEQDILPGFSNEEDKLARPDRIMIGENEVIIVDFKFPSLLKTDIPQRSEYQKQVSKYKRLLSLMGYGNIKAYLWVISEDNQQEIIEV
ncbi:MAG: UvrD-helicase domain-containing protein [Bacteroidales bacterium]|jgi:ATP-dependent exoDNAse (exonuclease V) beta subunit|nr:UvrD-helicase domain-containing protein [Bacteroidales bacterium]